MQTLKVYVRVIISNPQIAKNKICSMVKLKIIWDIFE